MSQTQHADTEASPDISTILTTISDRELLLQQQVKKLRRIEQQQHVQKTIAFNIYSQDDVLQLFQTISDFDDSTIFDLGTFITTVPFPSLWNNNNNYPDCFQLDNENCFLYQARLDLKPLYEKIIHLWKRMRPITVNVVGTIGYGKSYILAVLVLLLLKNRKSFGKKILEGYTHSPIILYIPDCQVMKDKHKFQALMIGNVLLNFPEYDGPLETVTDIKQFLSPYSVIVIADEFNSIENYDTECLDAKRRLSDYLGTSAAVEIYGMSLTPTAWKMTTKTPKSYIDMIYYGGFTDQEFDNWMLRHTDNVVFREHEDELVTLTGKTPLLLSVFERCYKDGDSWCSIVERVLQDQIVCDLQTCLFQFYGDKNSSDIKTVYLDVLSSRPMPADQTDIDHRFFYKDKKGFLCSIGEIVTRLFYQVLEKARR